MEELKLVLKDISSRYNIDYDELSIRYLYKLKKNIKDYSDVVFTDGSCINNGRKNAKGGFGVYFPFNTSYNISMNLGKTTNQESELVAIYHAMFASKGNDIFICTDSQYSINCLTKWIKNWRKNGWKTKKRERIKNYDIIIKINEYMNNNKNKKLTFFHINSHQKEPKNKNTLEWFFWNGNNMADQLAINSIK